MHLVRLDQVPGLVVAEKLGHPGEIPPLDPHPVAGELDTLLVNRLVDEDGKPAGFRFVSRVASSINYYDGE